MTVLYEKIVEEACKQAKLILRHRLVEASDEAVEISVREAVDQTREWVYAQLGGE